MSTAFERREDVPDPGRRFRRLQARLRAIAERISHEPTWAHTSVVVPSLSMDREELAKVQGVSFYEERLLFSLIRLRHPRVRMIFVSSQPIHPDIVDYYLQLLVGVPARHARSRLSMVCVQDASPEPLTAKLLARPRLLGRLRQMIGDRERAYLTCFNSTDLERRLALELDIPLNGVDPDLLSMGTKSGSREVFAEAGIEYPLGFENLVSEDDVVGSLVELARRRPGLERAVVKLNHAFAGTGNAIFRYPEARDENAIRSALDRLEFSTPDETRGSFLSKVAGMGGVVEEFVEGEGLRSPSVQARVHPDGELELVSTHDQVLGGSTGQSYVGCEFPADGEYRAMIQAEAKKVGEILAARGVVSRFGIDFVVFRRDGEWRCSAIEINLRMGGTTHPFWALQFLTGGMIDPITGDFLTQRGQKKYYFSTDNLRSPAYRGLLPEDLMDIVTLHGLHYQPATDTGVLFHMIGGLSQFGKVGVTCIADSRPEAAALYRRTAEVLDRETGAGSRDVAVPLHPLDAPLVRME